MLKRGGFVEKGRIAKRGELQNKEDPQGRVKCGLRGNWKGKAAEVIIRSKGWKGKLQR